LLNHQQVSHALADVAEIVIRRYMTSCSNHDSYMHRFQYIITCLAYMTATDLDKSFNSFIKVKYIIYLFVT